MSTFDEKAQALIQGLKDRDPEAVEGLVMLYTPVLKGWVRDQLRRRGIRDRWFDDPSDVVQDLWERFFRKHL